MNCDDLTFSCNFLLSQQKQQENEQALKLFLGQIRDLDLLPLSQRWVHLARGLLAGNVFDWGAKEVATIMENENLGFEEALKKIPGDWLVIDVSNGFASW